MIFLRFSHTHCNPQGLLCVLRVKDLVVLMGLLFTLQTNAQRPTPTVAGEEKVFLLGADSITISKLPDGSEIRRVKGKVTFQHKGAIMHCNLAIHNVLSLSLIHIYGVCPNPVAFCFRTNGGVSGYV